VQLAVAAAAVLRPCPAAGCLLVLMLLLLALLLLGLPLLLLAVLQAAQSPPEAAHLQCLRACRLCCCCQRSRWW
jgi:hypothetical protein